MADGEDVIAVFGAAGACKGLWENDVEPVSNGEGVWGWPRGSYLLRRPGGPMAGHFNAIANLLQGD